MAYKKYEIRIIDNMKHNVTLINLFLNNNECSEFRIKSFNGYKLNLVGSFDLSYYHNIDIGFIDVQKIISETYFVIDRFELINPTEFITLKYIDKDYIEFSLQSGKDTFQRFVCCDFNVSFDLVKYY